MFETNIKPYFEMIDSMEFRREKLWREEMDVLLTRLLPGLKTIFSKHVGKYAMPGVKDLSMSLEEFIDMMDQAQLIEENFG